MEQEKENHKIKLKSMKQMIIILLFLAGCTNIKKTTSYPNSESIRAHQYIDSLKKTMTVEQWNNAIHQLESNHAAKQ